MATLTVNKVSLGLNGTTGVYAGKQVTPASCASGGDQFLTTGININRTEIIIENGDASTHYIRINAQNKCSDGHKHDIGDSAGAAGAPSTSVPVAAGARLHLGPIDAEMIDTNGYVQIRYDGVTSMKISIIELAEKGRP